MTGAWSARALGDVCRVIAGQSPDGKSYNSVSDGIPFYQGKKEFGERYIGDPTIWTTAPTKIAEAGDILMSVRAPVGPVNLATEQVCIGRGLAAIRPGSPIDRDFLFYQLVHMEPGIAGTEGAVFPSISRKSIEALPVVSPPLAEQRRIVAILDEGFAGIAVARENAEKNLRNARTVFESHLESLFTREDDVGTAERLSDVCERITVGHVGPMAKRYKQTGVPFLRSQNIRPFEVVLDNVVYIDDAFHQSLAKSRLRPGDLAIVRTGYPGTAAVIPPELPDANCADLVIVRPGPVLSPQYLAAFFNSDYGKKLVGGRLVGAAQKHFNVTAAKAVTLRVPPLPVQQKLVDEVESVRADVRRLESIYERKLAALDELKTSLLHQAFNGEL